MTDNSSISNLLRAGDILVLDRGFRDCVKFLEEKGYNVKMPCLKGRQKQLSWKEANYSRLITKIRWVVESVHGIIAQKYILLHHQLDNKYLLKVKSFFQIAGFLHNTFSKRLDCRNHLSYEIIERMQSQEHIANTLAEEVEENNFNLKRVCFRKITDNDMLDFPEMSLDEIKIFCTGIHQLKQAVSYLGELLGDNNELNLEFHKEKNNLVRIKMKSRHKTSKTYRIYIEYTPNGTGLEGIKRYVCECPNGLRTVGCCSHIATVLFFFMLCEIFVGCSYAFLIVSNNF